MQTNSDHQPEPSTEPSPLTEANVFVPPVPRAPIAVVCALDLELLHLRTVLPSSHQEWRADRRVWRTQLEEQPLVLALSGLGQVSAAAVTENIIGHYQPAAVLNYGCAGAHRAELLPGDLVIGSRYVAYDNIREAPDGTERYVGMRYLYRDQDRRVSDLSAAPHLLDRALAATATLQGTHEPWPPTLGWPASAPHRNPMVVIGTIASADRWNRSTARIARLATEHNSLCEDMEAAAIALTCASHDVPFLAVKDIANNELLRSTVSGTVLGEECGEQLGRRAAMLVLAILSDLAEAVRTDLH